LTNINEQLKLNSDQLKLRAVSNKDVATLLRNFAKYYSIAEDNYRSMAYRNAANTIENLEEDISLYQDIDKLTALPKIGPGTAEKIKEFLDTGKSESLEELKRTVVPDSFKAELYEIEGFGKSTIEELFRHFTIRNMEELENVLKTKAVRHIPGFGEKKAKKLLISLEEHRSGGRRRNIFLQEAWDTADLLLNGLKDENIEKISVVGSMRRMKPIVNDIDIIASVNADKGHDILLKFTKLEQVKRVVSIGDVKAIVVLKNGIQADILVVKPEEYYTALQYFTGSKEHNIQLRIIAKDKGYLLSEYGLFVRNTDERIEISSEEELYGKLGVQYPDPTKR
jgi:DNA polymerase (family 10)